MNQPSAETPFLLQYLSGILENEVYDLRAVTKKSIAIMLALKCFSHSSSAYYLHSGTYIKEINVGYFDFGSVKVLARSAFESYLVFRYLITDDCDDDERALRIISWQFHDLIMRQRFPTELPESKEIKDRELICTKNFLAQMELNSVFQSLSNRIRDNLRKGKMWRRKPWKEIALSSGIGPLMSESIYSLMCSFAHSGFLSCQQIRAAKEGEQQIKIIEVAIRYVNVTLAFFIFDLIKFLALSRPIFPESPKFEESLEVWLHLGRA